jgi:hypothetical protein
LRKGTNALIYDVEVASINVVLFHVEEIMLVNRIVRALSFQRDVYAEVENDTTFTNTAWGLVVVIAILNQLGTHASTDLGNWLTKAGLGTVAAIVGFAVAAFVMNWVGRTLFNADVSFEEVVRTLGLAYVWNVVGVLGIVAGFSGFLTCLITPALILGWIMLIVSWFVALKEALDLEVGPTIVTVVIGWVAFGIIMAIASSVMAIIGLTTAGVLSIFGL